MNRVYLDPNTKYSDQYSMLAKMPDIVDEINEVADKAEQVPDPAVADIGKVLGIVSDGESGAKIDAVEPSGGLPTIAAGDAGKVLTVNAGETGAEWDAVDALPAISSGDAGKVLTVNVGETGAEWANAPSELPAIGASDAGKVLKVNAGHTGVEWGAASGGVTMREVDATISVTNTKIQNLCNGTVNYQWVSGYQDKAADEYAILGESGPVYWEIASSADSTKKVTLIGIPGFGTSYDTAKYLFTLTLFRVTDPIAEFTYTGASKSTTEKVLLIKGVQSGS